MHPTDLNRRTTLRALKRMACLVIVSATSVTLSRPAWSWTGTGNKLPNNTYSYRTNPNLFVAPPTGLPNFVAGATAENYEFWIAQAASVWRDRTGANISIQYAGNTARNGQATCQIVDLQNDILAVSGCFGTWCPVAANYRSYSGTNVVDSDICISRGNPGLINWQINTVSFPGNATDLISVLVHEIGHAMESLDDASTTVMNGAYLGETFHRYPAGADISGMQALYGARSETPCWRFSGNGWTVLTSVPVTTNIPVTISRGRKGSSGTLSRVVVGSSNALSNSVTWSVADHSISGAGSWTNKTLTGWVTTNRPPAVAGRSNYTGPELWVSAVASLPSNFGVAPGIVTFMSTDAFSTVVVVTLPDHTLHEPALTYEGWSGRFVLAWVVRDYGPGAPSNDKIFARTTTDGINWTAPQDLGQWTIDAVDLSCGSSPNCVMSYIDAATFSGLKPILTSRRFTVDPSTGFITMWDHTNSNLWTMRTPSVAGISTPSGTTYTSLLWSNLLGHYAQGEGYVYTSYSTANPPAYSWTYQDFAKHRADLSGSMADDNFVYLAYVK